MLTKKFLSEFSQTNKSKVASKVSIIWEITNYLHSSLDLTNLDLMNLDLTNLNLMNLNFSDGSGCQKSGAGRVGFWNLFSGSGRARVYQKIFGFSSGLSEIE